MRFPMRFRLQPCRFRREKFDQMLISLRHGLRFGRKARVLALYLLRYQTALTTPVGPV